MFVSGDASPAVGNAARCVLRGESCCGSTRVGVAAAAGGGRSCWDNTQLQRSVFLAGVDKANAVSGGSFFPVFFLPC